ncbi:MAG: hypothetical protein WCG87_11185 [Bacteroidota bacterium]
MNKISITHFGNAHNQWLRSLDFYKGELRILKTRLTEIAGKNTAADVMTKVEHFENQFKVQTDNIDRMLHDINMNMTAIGKQAQSSSAGYVDGVLLVQHNELNQKYRMEEKTINDLRHDFNDFAAAWM